MKKLTSIIWGLALITVGVIFALNALNITHINIFFDGWWTLFIIIPCGVSLITGKDRTGSLIGVLIGVFLLLCCQGILEFAMLWKLALPAIIILIGIRILMGSLFGDKVRSEIRQLENGAQAPNNGFAAFSGSNLCFDGEVFRGAELNAVFGGIKYDLRNALIPEDCVIKATAIFGGIDILLPPDVNVKLVSNSIFGGVSNKRGQNRGETAVTVYVEGSGIFGGVDIK